MLSFNLKPVFKARGIDRPFTFLYKAGFSRNTAHNLLNSKSVTFHLKHIERLCAALNCTPNDVLLWEPDANVHLPEDHPLNELKDTNPDYNWQDTIKTLPLEKLEQLVSVIKGAKAGTSE